MASSNLTKILSELGLISLYHSHLDTKLLCLQRFVRMFAYGGSTLILVAFLSALNISKTQIGLFMTLTLVGDVLISFVLTLFADALGRKSILAIGSLMMMGSGVVFATCGNYWGLLAAAVFGVISPSGNELGPFRAIEESILAQTTSLANRPNIFAWYTLSGPVGQSIGTIISGWTLDYMRNILKWDETAAYRCAFWAYGLFGAVKFLLSIALSHEVEVEKKAAPIEDPETAPLLGDGAEDVMATKKSFITSKLPDISKESRLIVLNICLLWGLDSFASGLITPSWITYYFHEKFHLDEGRLGSIFATTAAVSAVSILVASSIAKRIGNVKTMVFTHLPSAIFLALVPFPSTLAPAATFLILRHCISNMDTAVRSAFIASVVYPHERTAVMGLINVVKTLGTSIPPLITGYLVGHGTFWIAFVTAAALKVVYDLGVLAMFVGHKTHDDKAEEQRLRDESEVRVEADATVER